MLVRAEKLTEEVGQTDGLHWVSAFECDCYSPIDTFVRDATGNVPAMKSPATTAEASVITVPLNSALVRATASRGMKISSVELYYEVASAVGTAAALAVYKVTLGADNAALTAAAVTGSKDLTDAHCYDQEQHKVVWTPTAEAFIGDNEAWYAVFSLTKGAGTNLYFFGALVNFTRAL